MKYTLDYEKYAELARRVAAEGSVLLRNEDGVLPCLLYTSGTASEIQGNISKKLYQACHRVGISKNDIAGKAK